MSTAAPSHDSPKDDGNHGHGLHKMGMGALVFAAMGVVFGDIGTSPLYAVKECFSGNPEKGHFMLPLDQANVLGIISLVLWSLIVLVCIKYAFYVLKADNKGEGGVLSMMSLALRGEGEGRRKRTLLLLGIFGAALLFGDGMITPAISVLSAVEGLNEAKVFAGLAGSTAQNITILITCIILIGLFGMQFLGTDKVGKFFGPVTLLWFGALAGLGIYNIIKQPSILQAFNPSHAWYFLSHGGWHHFIKLGSVVLCVTGCESMYADMGHFGAKPIRIGWFWIVFPALMLNYLGQGALLLDKPDLFVNNNDPNNIVSPFFQCAPSFLLIPLVILATAATVIASQALISGTYSLTLSAIQMGYLPRTTIRHTSEHARGQIYIPLVNWLLMIMCILLVVSFKSSTNLAAAYGVGVIMTMMVTSLLIGVVAVKHWNWPKPLAFAFSAIMFAVEAAFLTALTPKFADGGWFPVAVAIGLFTLMTTWKTGRSLVGAKLEAAGLPHELLIESLKRRMPTQVKGTAIFMSSSKGRTPVALLHNMKHNGVIHERVVFMTLVVDDTPYVRPSKRVDVEDLGSGFWRVTGHYGFMQKPNVPRLLRRCKNYGLDVSAEESTFFLGREIIVPSDHPGMAKWREHLFGFASKIAQQPATYFQIPIGRVIELGQQVEI
jgi:KUP system potassium uptake protein